MSDKFALVIGNSAYSDVCLSQLQAPSVDVAYLSHLLSDATIGEFSEVVQLIDPSVAQAQKEIAKFFSKRRGHDLLLFYFSGHGVLDVNGRLYLALADTEHDLLSGTALSASFIRDEMQNSLSRSQVLILDCCHSGAFDKAKAAIGSSVGTGLIFQSTGKLVLTATDALQIALEGDSLTGKIKPSIFTRYLVEGLETGLADLNNDGLISVDELYEYTYNKVIADDSTSQTPLKIGKQGGQIVIAKNPIALNSLKSQGSEKSMRAFEILGAAYRDWVTFEKQEYRLLDRNDLNLIFEQIEETALPAPLLEYTVYSVAKERQISETGVNKLQKWFASLEEIKANELIGQLLQNSDDRTQEWIIALAHTLKLRTTTKLLLDLLEANLFATPVIRRAIEVIYAFESKLPPTLARSLVISQNDWMVHALALRSIDEKACLLISDGSIYAQDIGKIIENVGIKVSTLNALNTYEIEKHGGFELLRPFALIVLVRGEHYASLEGDTFQLLLREYVKNGGRLFATCWFSWEIEHSDSVIADVLPFLHNRTLDQDFYEDVAVRCRPTDNELSRALFSLPLSFRSSFEPLRPREKSIVLLEQESGNPVLGFHHFHKGICYYLNTCQHSCTTIMPSPTDSDSNLREGLKRFFEWVFEIDAQSRK